MVYLYKKEQKKQDEKTLELEILGRKLTKKVPSELEVSVSEGDDEIKLEVKGGISKGAYERAKKALRKMGYDVHRPYGMGGTAVVKKGFEEIAYVGKDGITLIKGKYPDEQLTVVDILIKETSKKFYN